MEQDKWLTATQINTYGGDYGCPRKWFRRYVLKERSPPSIHIIRGNIVHKALELYFKKSLHQRPNPTDATLQEFERLWADRIFELKKLPLKPPEDLDFYYQDSRQMVLNGIATFTDTTSSTEKNFWCHEHKIWCKIDRRFLEGDWINYIDYKTTKSDELTIDARLQLVIQWLCAKETDKTDKIRIGAHFLKFDKHPELWVPTQEDIDWTLNKIQYFRENTVSTHEEDYPCTCGWCRR